MLQGERLVLREWRESDLQDLALLRNDVELQALLMARAKPNSIERVRHWLSERTSREEMSFFVAAARVDDAVLGYLQIANIDRYNEVGELGICLAHGAQGNGLAREACQLLEPYLRQVLGLRKLTLQVLASNERAVSFYRKSGYREVGRLEQHFHFNGQYHDVLVMERFLSE
ncbi:diamine N-acetyltransferase [Dyella sp. OK004]|uniref:GNAT family N-acetyltransferase n=1 Tax=Dyella sp. OK004 TaxID=1855292 RepID=UPI0008E0E5F4|nr:GNAT family protein [Dyella sp. OK004]SFS05904.1 diamine N-acetyltransferase [Dyella sp. OK004]